MVDVGVRQLQRSRDRLERSGEASAAGEDEATAGLLLFYSAECGLKAEVMRRRRLRDTSQLPEEFRTHDLRVLAKELNWSPQTQRALKGCARPRNNGRALPKVEPPALHEAWRYGADLEPEDEKQSLAALRTLISESRE
ncbi:hypothetical protein [Streptomyces adelaidensis]|uniref:hypothetical protein n=1 Tax=Streptomyces adelaidensis TaxID=2796465 RepID=UPI0019075993|nr:hypothetical protein [Streptomyces adelaidensis]